MLSPGHIGKRNRPSNLLWRSTGISSSTGQGSVANRGLHISLAGEGLRWAVGFVGEVKMRRNLRTFLAALATIASMALVGACDNERQPFLNLARIDISVQGEQQASNLFGLVRTFASERDYSIQGAPFPKRGRIVT